MVGRPLVELDNVTVAYRAGDRQHVAVTDVNLEVSRGAFVSVVGPTGCGKSTVLNVVAGLLAPTSGGVRIDGTSLWGRNTRAGYLFQQDTLLPWKTVLENVCLGLELAGVDRAERREQARDWLSRVGLSGFEDAHPHQLSGGMRKRTAVAQVCVCGPEILLMDEPFSALDAQTRQLMENELLTLWTEAGTTVLFVTHDLDEAVSLSDEIVLFSAGPASTVARRYEVDLPRPRDLMRIRTARRFGELYEAVWSDLRKEVMKAHGRRDTVGHG
ncbi:ABC transporter ATP-binding protein [Longimycelium tulufanense]|uniref:ABC transporter ATP-binding protein n=1 Tax=Longimycelium tulufanense TaxID=907463 RepID=A0A8J3CBN1_9PSEU|nr:ABC transporter ATP-binding protein [Longimycelium tulufanense]GGM70595.1 ABC transporter ATP-binding protein [Longimycelium tulufanense]